MINTVKAWLKARWGEISTKLGLIFGAITAAAIAANGMQAPWSYVAAFAAFGAVIYKEDK